MKTVPAFIVLLLLSSCKSESENIQQKIDETTQLIEENQKLRSRHDENAGNLKSKAQDSASEYSFDKNSTPAIRHSNDTSTEVEVLMSAFD